MRLLTRLATLATRLGPLALLALFAFSAAAQDARIAIERASRYIELGDYALTRSYLETPLIDGRITHSERSRAYYLEGYSFEQQNFPVSAAQSYVKALAFNPDNPATLAALGHLYQNGKGVAQDSAQAAQLLQRSAELGYGPAMTGLGALLLAGLPDSPQPQDDLDTARSWLTKATQAASPRFNTPGQSVGRAFLFLAQSYRANTTFNPDPEQALAYYRQALLLNEPEAFNSIGHMHLNGEFGVADIPAAISEFTRGAQNGDSSAQVSLGYLHLLGTGLTADRSKARALFAKAAIAGDVRAHHYLGYLDETAEPPQPDAAQAHYSHAADSNHLPALIRLSQIAFANDQHKDGIDYLRRAARSGDAKVNHQLAWLLATSQDKSLRDGSAAVGYARVAVASTTSAATLDTLAAAYAEDRQFDAAVRTQNQALALLETDATSAQEHADYSTRLARYQRGEPWRADTL